MVSTDEVVEVGQGWVGWAAKKRGRGQHTRVAPVPMLVTGISRLLACRHAVRGIPPAECLPASPSPRRPTAPIWKHPPSPPPHLHLRPTAGAARPAQPGDGDAGGGGVLPVALATVGLHLPTSMAANRPPLAAGPAVWRCLLPDCPMTAVVWFVWEAPGALQKRTLLARTAAIDVGFVRVLGVGTGHVVPICMAGPCVLFRDCNVGPNLIPALLGS